MATKKKFASITSARMKAHPTKKKEKRSSKRRVAKTAYPRSEQTAVVHSFEFFGASYQAPAKVVYELQRKLREYQKEGEGVVGVDTFLSEVKGDLPDWAIYLKGLRQREDLTQKEMAAVLGLTQSNISDMERGRRPIGKNLAKKIANEFNADYRLLL